ncbi:hypothetical protein ANO11243_076940 [Dothideomycetidae sp. 11243]|nr:hypothetical protein ANO11243_076940 [fungal sp. No.11243]
MAYDPQNAYQAPSRQYYPPQPQHRQPPQRAPYHHPQAYDQSNSYQDGQYGQDGYYDNSAYGQDMYQQDYGRPQGRGHQDGYAPQYHNGRGDTRHDNRMRNQQQQRAPDPRQYNPDQRQYNQPNNDVRQGHYPRDQQRHRPDQRHYERAENNRRPPPPPQSSQPPYGGQGVYQQPQYAQSTPNQARVAPLSPLQSSHSLDYPPPGAAQSRSQRSRPPPLERAGSAEHNPHAQRGHPRKPLIEPVSPTTLPQDNAFPLFPTPKKKSSKQSSDDIQADLPLSDRQHAADDLERTPQTGAYSSDRQAPPPVQSPTFHVEPPRTDRQHSHDSASRNGMQPQHRGPSPQSHPYNQDSRPQRQERYDERRDPPSQSQDYDRTGQALQAPHQGRYNDRAPPSPRDNPNFSHNMPLEQRSDQSRQGYSGQDNLISSQPGPGHTAYGHPGQSRSAPGDSRSAPFQLPHRPGTAQSVELAPKHAPTHTRGSSQSELYANGYIDDIGRMTPELDRDAQIEAEMPDFENMDRSQPSAHRRGKTIDEHLKSPPVPQQQQHQPMPPPPYPHMYSNQNGSVSAPNMRTAPGPTRTPSGGNPPGPHPANQPPKPAYYQEQYQQRPQQGPPVGASGQGYGPRPIPQRPGTADQYGRPSFDGNRSIDGRGPPGRAPSAPPGHAPSFGTPLSKQSSANSNPDALPQHPVPVRPGLMNGGNGGPPQQGRPSAEQRVAGGPQGRPQPGPPASTSSTDSRRSSIHVPVTQAEINHLQSLVNAHPQDAATALLLAKKLVEAGSVLASENGRLDARQTAKNRERYILDAHRRVKKLVSSGYPDAMFYLADCYGQGLLGLEEDPKEAFTLYQQAAKAGHGEAAYRTAMCCEIGPDEGGGTRKDPQKAVQWYRRAAQLQDPAAMFKLGVICLKGLLSETKNVVEAERWLKRAAEKADKDHPHALHELGALYEPDHSDRDVRAKIIPDEKYSRELYFKAAQMNYTKSQFRLGQAYEYGALGLPVDARNSIAWYSKAAAQGEHQAELALSGWYLTGAEGILQNSDQEAYLWARKAAMADPPLAKAMFAMGYYTETGIGCPTNMEEAKRWYGRAASYKFPKAIDRLEEIKRSGGKIKPLPQGGRLQRKDVKEKVR